MAVILSIQFYFTQQTQKDIIDELTQISTKINRVTEGEFIEDQFEDYRIITSEEDKANDAPHFQYYSKFDSLLKRVEQGKKSHINIRPGSDGRVFIDQGFKEDFHVRVFERKVNQPRAVLKVGTSKKKGKAQIDKKILVTNDDSLNYYIREIEVDLNPVAEFSKDSVKWTARGLNRFIKEKSAPSFTFVVPDFSKPTSPRILRLNYDMAELNTALDKIRNRNILITILIFAVSIIGIMVITRKSFKPIDSLKQSFERVVDGDLSVTVDEQSKDEIGALTNSFNQMVSELKKNREKEVILRRKERLASLGQLAAGVAHEIKNPLNAINLTIDHLGDKILPKKDKQAEKYIQTIQTEIRRLDKIVNNFLNYLRSEELEKKDTDVNALISEVIQLYERELISCEIEFSENLDSPFIFKVDSERLKTALVNIIINAIQAMPEGGRLLISTSLEDKSIKIVDTGIGIEKKDLENIFDIFYTTKSSGTGLGLPTAYKIVKAHSGNIEIKSEIGKGSEVRITLS